MKIFKNFGMLLLGIWLIATGLIPLVHPRFSGLGTVMAILAIAAGALILVGRWSGASRAACSSLLLSAIWHRHLLASGQFGGRLLDVRFQKAYETPFAVLSCQLRCDGGGEVVS
jgi:hypothetical protein